MERLEVDARAPAYISKLSRVESGKTEREKERGPRNLHFSRRRQQFRVSGFTTPTVDQYISPERDD